ncbi:histidine phosphatase superfamily [Scenedesmus sp. NREL 46B-D3]|nr:histidine phosphatase superfamily [Scenedesmus sp. NREL 46B-D3]
MQQMEVLPSRSDTKHRRLDRAAAVLFHRAGLLLVLVLLCASGSMRLRVCASSSSFDIKEHLSTKAPYVHRVRVQGAPSLYDVPDPSGYKPVFLYLLARHGSRWPTAKRMRQINSLQTLFRAAHSTDPTLAWTNNWTSPVADVPYLAGELHPEGEAELEGLARRLRGRFPGLAAGPYAPRRHPIISTQVPRAAQSASAFALGFFGHSVGSSGTHQPLQQQEQQQSSSGHQQNSHHTRSTSRTDASNPSSSNGDASSSSSSSSWSEVVGSWRPQPVAISMLPKRHDPVLRFFESCKGYREHEDRALRWLAPWLHSHWRSITPDLEAKLGLTQGSLTACHVDALWQLCTLEAGLMSTDGHQAWQQQQQQQQPQGKHGGDGSSNSSGSNACGLFSQSAVMLLEWLEDVRLYETQGYGAEVNYGIAAPLLSDIASALTSAATAHATGTQPLQRVRLHFAHCETLTPLATLLGLFTPGAAERQDMPEVPSARTLKATVKISAQQVGGVWRAGCA